MSSIGGLYCTPMVGVAEIHDPIGVKLLHVYHIRQVEPDAFFGGAPNRRRMTSRASDPRTGSRRARAAKTDLLFRRLCGWRAQEIERALEQLRIDVAFGRELRRGPAGSDAKCVEHAGFVQRKKLGRPGYNCSGCSALAFLYRCRATWH